MKILSIDPGTKNMGICIVECKPSDISGDTDCILFWKCIGVPSTALQVVSVFKNLLEHEQYDKVVIEAQPPKNTSMFRTQHYLEVLFALNETPCIIMPALAKLKYAQLHMKNHWPHDTLAANKKEKWSYTKRKKLALTTIQSFLQNTSQSQEIREIYHRAAKKDDFADCALQAIACARYNVALKKQKYQKKNKIAASAEHAGVADSGATPAPPHQPSVRFRSSGPPCSSSCVEEEQGHV